MRRSMQRYRGRGWRSGSGRMGPLAAGLLLALGLVACRWMGEEPATRARNVALTFVARGSLEGTLTESG